MDIKYFEIKKDEKPLDNIKQDCGFSCVFKSVGVIGDSLASGEFESHSVDGTIEYHDMYEYSWPSILERITGTKYNNYSRGGMTAKEYFDSWANINDFWKWNQAYIIALGNNDTFVFHHPLGKVSDINLKDPDKNADTFYGNLGKIISKIKTIEKNARIFIVSPLLRGELIDDQIKEIGKGLSEITKLFSFTYYIDLINYGPIYDKKMRDTFAMGFHPNCMGYYAYALMIGNYIDYIIRKNPKDFFEIPFIGTNFKNKDIEY